MDLFCPPLRTRINAERHRTLRFTALLTGKDE
jgi:hypothetical protein